MSGMIQGGWGFVYAAYGFTGFALASYLTSVIWRLRAETKARASPPATPDEAHSAAPAHPTTHAAEAVS